MANWSIFDQPHGKMVTCQRPIVIRTRVTSGAVAHFVGALWIKKNGLWTDTNVRMNGYGDNNSYYFTLNFAEYCRNYFILPFIILWFIVLI